jgi:hypothetical protein
MRDEKLGEYMLDNPEVIGDLPDGMELVRDGDNIVIIDQCENTVAFGWRLT